MTYMLAAEGCVHLPESFQTTERRDPRVKNILEKLKGGRKRRFEGENDRSSSRVEAARRTSQLPDVSGFRAHRQCLALMRGKRQWRKRRLFYNISNGMLGATDENCARKVYRGVHNAGADAVLQQMPMPMRCRHGVFDVNHPSLTVILDAFPSSMIRHSHRDRHRIRYFTGKAGRTSTSGLGE